MPWVGSNFSLLYNWNNDLAAMIPVTASRVQAEDENIAGGINDCLNRHGNNSPSGDIPMANNKFTGVGNATARNQFGAVGQIQDGSYIFGTTGGTANAQTLSPTPAITTYVAGQMFRVLIGVGLTNTTASPTLAVSGLASPKVIADAFGNGVMPGQLVAGCIVDLVYSGTAFILLTPSVGQQFSWKQTVAGAASVAFAGFPAYDTLEVDFSGVIPSNAGDSLLCRFELGGALKTDANYSYDVLENSNSAATASRTTGATSLAVTGDIGTTANWSANGSFKITGYGGGSFKQLMGKSGYIKNATGRETALDYFGIYINSTAAVTGLTFLMANNWSGVVGVRGFKL